MLKAILFSKNKLNTSIALLYKDIIKAYNNIIRKLQ